MHAPKLLHLLPAVLLFAAGCFDEHPTAPPIDPPEEAEIDSDGGLNGRVFAADAHAFPAETYTLLSSEAELEEGRYRYRTASGSFPAVERDGFILADTDVPVVRRVLERRMDGDALVLETGPAYWHEVIRGGTYAVNIPFGHGEAPSFAIDGISPNAVTGGATGLPMPPLERTFRETDVCQWIHDALELIPGEKEREICGKEMKKEIGTGIVLSVAGTLDSLRILGGNVRVTGDMDIALTVDPGSITGGSPPVFSPCNRGHYLGCVSTPTGAALIDFLRRYAPSVPEASLPPVRVCVPGTNVRIRAGYWSGWTWNPPVWERCRISNFGTLPQIVLPSVAAVDSEIRPRVEGQLDVRIKGDGVFGVQIAIPSLAANAAYHVTNDFNAKASIGVFVLLRASLLNGGGTVRFTFDDTGRVTQSWTGSAGWDTDFELTDKNRSAQLLRLDNPDSIIVRIGIPVEAKAQVCIAIIGCEEAKDSTSTGSSSAVALALPPLAGSLGPAAALGVEGGSGIDGPWGARPGDGLGGAPATGLGGGIAAGGPDATLAASAVPGIITKNLNIGAKVGAAVSMFYEGTWSRPQIDPDDPLIDNWNISLDGAYDLSVAAGLTIPLTGWIMPNVPRSFSRTWECCRVSVSDYWGQGQLEVTASTTGGPAPETYGVVVERADSIPGIVDEGAQRLGRAWRARRHESELPAGGAALFGPPGGVVPCLAVYSDAFLAANPVFGLATAGARAIGVGQPTYAVTSPCWWLIARYKVTLTGVPESCTVEGGAARDDVWLEQTKHVIGRTGPTTLHFDVDCGSEEPLGALEVTTPPFLLEEGEPRPAVALDGTIRGLLSEENTLSIDGLRPGERELRLLGVPGACASDPVTVTVVAGEVTAATVPVVCAMPDEPPFGKVHFQASLEGDASDPNGYEITVDGEAAAPLPVEGTGTVSDRPASTPQVYLVSDIADRCQPLAPNPRLLALNENRDPIHVPFPVRCTAVEPETLQGRIDAGGSPVAVTLRSDDGRTLAVRSGPKTAELARLAGSAVRVWGATSATGIDVHGYELLSSLGDDRWTGIVLVRGGEAWLFGERARRLVDPPEALVQASGAFVWIAGSEVGDALRPTLFGVLREAP